MLRQAELGKKKLPRGFDLVYKRNDMLILCRTALGDRSPVVRSEMLTALGRVKLDEPLLELLIPAFKDPSWLVRLRVVELIGASGTKGRKSIIDYFASDDQEYVKNMARALKVVNGR